MKQSFIIGNWKMYASSIADAHVLATSIRNNAAAISGVKMVICPPALWLSDIREIIKKGGRVSLGVQNIFYEEDGAYTGEISPTMAKEIAEYAIIGHSERREYFGETNLDVNEKVHAALKAGLFPIICIGEKSKSTNPIQPIRELKEAIMHVSKKDLKNIIIAYEPVWAIGTGENAEPEYVAKVATRLREFLDAETPILYGGSVKSSNIAGYAKRPEIDGVLVGGASVRASEFVKICQIWSESKSIKIKAK